LSPYSSNQDPSWENVAARFYSSIAKPGTDAGGEEGRIETPFKGPHGFP